MKHCILIMVAIFLCITSLGLAQESKDSAMFNNVLAKVSDEIPDGYNLIYANFDSSQFKDAPKFIPTIFSFNNPDTSNIELTLLNLVKDTVLFIHDTIWEPGQYSINLFQIKNDDALLPSGIYLINLEAKTKNYENSYDPPNKYYFRAFKKTIVMR
jgi:hypothetical protein